MEKNQGGKWIVFAFEDEGGSNPGEPKTGDAANITANVRIDGGAANAVDDTNPTELEDGYYIFDITAAESNGDLLLIAPASGTANINVIGVPGVIYTRPANWQALSVDSNGRTDVIKIAGTTQTANDNGADINDILVDTAVIGTVPALDGAAQTIGAAIAKIADDNGGADFDATTDSLEKIYTKINAQNDINSTDVEIACDASLLSYDAPTHAELTSAFTDLGLDHLLSASVTGTDITDNSIIAYLVSKEATADWDDFVNTTDSLQAIRDNQAGADAAAIAAAVWDKDQADHVGAGTFGVVASEVADILVDTGTTLPATLATIDGIVDDISVDTGTTLPATLTTIDGIVDDILVDTGTTLPATLATMEGKIDTVDGVADDILVDTGTTLPATLATIDGIVDDILVDTGTTLPATLATIDGIVDDILADTNELQSDDVPTLIAALQTDLDSLTDAYGEPGQGAPGVSETLLTKVAYLYKSWRNKKRQDSDDWDLYADDGTTVDQNATISDDGTDAIKGVIGTGV